MSAAPDWDVVDDVGRIWSRDIGEFSLFVIGVAKGEWCWEVYVSEHLDGEVVQAIGAGETLSRKEAMTSAERCAAETIGTV